MKVLLVHNEYGIPSGEEAIVQKIKDLIEENGHQVILYIRRSTEISGMFFGNFNAFISGIYSRESRKTLKNLLVKHRPDVVHVHNLFPFISPSILPVQFFFQQASHIISFMAIILISGTNTKASVNTTIPVIICQIIINLFILKTLF